MSSRRRIRPQFEVTDQRFVERTSIICVNIDGTMCSVVMGAMSSESGTSRWEQRSFCAELLRIALRCQGIADPSTVRVEHEANGAPVLSSPDIGSVSISHDGYWGAVAVSPVDGRIGVDIQVPRRVSRKLLQRFAPDLAERAGDENAYVEFARRWTSREAVGKALGTGLRSELLSAVLPVARIGREFGAEYASLGRWSSPALSLAHTD
ncbi:4'-phosphopantetheinyl transferase family protein [Streptomyces sp. NPDC127117]|uniref:4'-phosphopantetheinyl transferase family protein n=1 Tax=Streptomyces sp. NPDC127117 TaxID=3345368 RepID=UPI0036272E9D